MRGNLAGFGRKTTARAHSCASSLPDNDVFTQIPPPNATLRRAGRTLQFTMSGLPPAPANGLIIEAVVIAPRRANVVARGRNCSVTTRLARGTRAPANRG